MGPEAKDGQRWALGTVSVPFGAAELVDAHGCVPRRGLVHCAVRPTLAVSEHVQSVLAGAEALAEPSQFDSVGAYVGVYLVLASATGDG